jgi:hypothetical protein
MAVYLVTSSGDLTRKQTRGQGALFDRLETSFLVDAPGPATALRIAFGDKVPARVHCEELKHAQVDRLPKFVLARFVRVKPE